MLSTLPEVRDRREAHALEGVGEGTASEPHTVGHHRETLLGEHDCGRFAGDIRGSIDGDPHIGRVECRAVVDDVTEVSDRLPASLERRDDLLLVPGFDLGEDVAFRDGSTQSSRTHPVDFVAGDDEFRAQSDAGRHRLGHETVVTAHHDDPHPERGEIGDLEVHVVFDVVAESRKADGVERRFRGDGDALPRAEGAGRDADGPDPVDAESVVVVAQHVEHGG